MWWPSHEGIQELIVTDTEEGFELSAPEGTECADWLAFWIQSPEHHQFFNDQFVKTLLSHLEHLDGQS
jgi:hypothetical protein